MSVIERMYECSGCGDLQRASEQNDVYGCHLCGKRRVEVEFVRADAYLGAVEALQMIAAVVNDEMARPTTRVKAARGLVNDALTRIGGQ